MKQIRRTGDCTCCYGRRARQRGERRPRQLRRPSCPRGSTESVGLGSCGGLPVSRASCPRGGGGGGRPGGCCLLARALTAVKGMAENTNTPASSCHDARTGVGLRRRRPRRGSALGGAPERSRRRDGGGSIARESGPTCQCQEENAPAEPNRSRRVWKEEDGQRHRHVAGRWSRTFLRALEFFLTYFLNYF